MSAHLSRPHMSKVCRLCLTVEEGMRSIFEEESFLGHVATTAQLEILEGDGLPAQVCKHCEAQLNLIWTFRQRCQNTDIVLRQWLDKESTSGPEEQQSESTSNSHFYNVKIEPEVTESEFSPSFTTTTLKLETVSDFEINPINNTEENCNPIDDSGGRLYGGEAEKDDHTHLFQAELSVVFNEEEDPEDDPLSVTQPCTDSSLFTCDLCQHAFFSKQALTRHMGYHSKVPATQKRARHWCFACSSVFTKKVALDDHILNVHTRKKVKKNTKDKRYRYKCNRPMCNKSFNVRSFYTIHMLTHRDEEDSS